MRIKLMLAFKTTLVIVVLGILTFKTLGTGYCYIKTPTNKGEANEVIKFCSKGNLWFSEVYSKSLAKIYEKYPDELHNETSATMLLNYYVKTNPLQKLDRIETLTNIIADDSWDNEKRFLFILEGGFLEENVPVDFRQKVFNKIHQRYKKKIINDTQTEESIKKISLEDIEFLHKKINKIK